MSPSFRGSEFGKSGALACSPLDAWAEPSTLTSLDDVRESGPADREAPAR